MLLLHCVTYISLVLLVFAGKTRHGKDRANSHGHDVLDPAERSLQDWRNLPAKVLKLACNASHILAGGSRLIMARRLYDFYHPPVTTSGPPIVMPEVEIEDPPVVPEPVPLLQSTSNSIPLTPIPLSGSLDLAAIVREEVQKLLRSPVNSGVASPSITTVPATPLTVPAPPTTIIKPAALSAQSNINQSSQLAMPLLPQAVINNIRNGEFVNFDNLLPNRAPINMDEYSFKVGGGSTPTVELVPRRQAKTKVTDFNSWMVAWNNFLRCFSNFFPHRIQELVHYQAIICDFANQFTFNAWSNYDRMFRYQAAYNAALSWNRVDDDLYNRYLRGATIQQLCCLIFDLRFFIQDLVIVDQACLIFDLSFSLSTTQFVRLWTL